MLKRTFNNTHFTKHKRMDIMPWQTLHNMPEDLVYKEISTITGIKCNKTIDEAAQWACLNHSSATFDFPHQDHTRALLGSLKMGYVSTEII